MSVTAVPLRPVAKGAVTKLWVGIGALSLAAVGLAFAGTSGQNWTTTPSGLQYRAVSEGEGPRPTAMDVVTFDYVGRLQDGTEFDSSKGRGPAEIPVFGVVPGFAEGLQLMTKGSTYEFRVPPELGYGATGQPPAIPPHATIEFEVTLRDFRSLSPDEIRQIQMMQQMQMQQMGGAGAPPPQGR